ncbi:MAG: divergent polysaccharide deacetylase family protein, partial [Proteobacteria bacterium]|nr:divergent polysaccharide deacetylase family protein [Pseudomonadota bacterium]
LLSVIFAAVCIAAVVLFFERVERGTPCGNVSPLSVTRQSPRKEAPGKALTPKTPAREAAERAAPTAGQQGQPIAVIIDDIGFDLRIVEELAGIPAPIAFAILPHSPHAAEAARFLHAAGKEILLHLPMEPHSYPEESPGAGALMVDMDERQIRRQLQENLAAVPYVSGVNNHMGSRFMEDEARLTLVMEELEKRGLYFVDSRTTPDSRGKEAAQRTGVRFAARNLFIDHLSGYAAAMENLTGPSRREGANGKPVLMIGHPHPETVRALRNALPRWQAEGRRLVTLKTFLETSAEENRNALAAGDKASGRKERLK